MRQYPALLNLAEQPSRRPNASLQEGFLPETSFGSNRSTYRNLRAVAPNGLDRATFHRLFAECFFLRRFGLLVYVGVSTIIVATEIRRGRFSAKITVNALIIDV